MSLSNNKSIRNPFTTTCPRCVFSMPQVPFPFAFESEQPSDNSSTKTVAELPFSRFGKVDRIAECHSAVILTLTKSDEW